MDDTSEYENTDHLWQLARVYDDFHRARASSPLVSRLYAQAMGDAYPEEVAPYSSCDWPLLGTLLGRLRLRPDEHLIDLGCGTGGVGLWLARALAARLTGIDISQQALGLAKERTTCFVPRGRAEFRHASMESTRLPKENADGIICIDALFKAPRRVAALNEIRRLLRPGGRAVVTAGGKWDRDGLPFWLAQAERAGLKVEAVDERPDEPAMWERLYRLWLRHEDELRHQLGETQTDSMIEEARRTYPRLAERRAIGATLRRPPGPANASYATR
ncbi:hypothetical protein GCM10010387_04020 [Streptomyces inusitatus]|uniref:Methyltransferase domain-containing protein n=1 Tax=Streptomyces inusitatus TaxID=68221 RepID=A0A918PL60_9ACTN|nr:class I SAM-dependent methyltransferase [Streptomyces inusitatus]GGZ14951.1 hypothetical protein GCM10010387_04020 [Streptomyces inusitatus]